MRIHADPDPKHWLKQRHFIHQHNEMCRFKSIIKSKTVNTSLVPMINYYAEVQVPKMGRWRFIYLWYSKPPEEEPPLKTFPQSTHSTELFFVCFVAW
jgi:hypothetical protein